MENLGVISNCWAKRLAAGDPFEDLVLRFLKKGFSDIEIRDGDYLRNSEFGLFIRELEVISDPYPVVEWKGVCETLFSGGDPTGEVRPADRRFFERTRRFHERCFGTTFTYALQHPWSRPANDPEHDRRIVSAKKIAYLLSPGSARMRLVDIGSPERIDASAAAANLDRYHALASELPITHAVENSNQSAFLTLKIAAGAGFFIAYDEANLFLPDNRILEQPDRFWESLDPRWLTSVHLKQKSAEGVLPRLGPGRVDLCAILTRIREISFTGDLLLENAPSEDPLQEAIMSRDYLSGLPGF